MEKRLTIVLLILYFSISLQAEGMVKSIARSYCAITHPVEMMSPIRHDNTCEEQHIIQQQHGGTNWGNISIISASSHITTDTWMGDGVLMQGKVWENNIKEDGWGLSDDSEDALAQAYKLGRWQLEYVFFTYNYKSDKWSSTLLNWDGVSHLVYGVSWWVNLPSKYIRKAAYLVDKNYYGLLIDHAIQLPILIIEGSVGIVYSLAGVVTGTIMQPIDTLNALLGGLYLVLKSILFGIIDIFLSIFTFLKSIF
ncbi:MAG: hypothetical protein U9O56_06770 [Campylobacterota bacterium]|nr:hypothetical protein [Campylobacterota bacterium]